MWPSDIEFGIWPAFQFNFVYLKYRYDIFKFFSIVSNFMSAKVSQEPTNRIQFSNAIFFDKDDARIIVYY